MIQVIGRFKRHNNKVILVIDLDKENFEKVMKHIINNMFFAYKRVAPAFKGFILNSIGDHLNSADHQNLKEAEICMQVSIPNPPPKDEIYLLERDDTWYVSCACDTEQFNFSLVKESQLINTRNYVDAG